MYKRIRRIIVATIGFTILIIGLLLVFLPGPAFVIIPVGLAVLATEFVWAKKLLDKVKNMIKRNKESK